MLVVTAKFIKGKKVLLRYDIDVALRSAQGKLVVGEEFKLRAGIPTLKLCLENASKVIIVGHLGRPAPPAERGEPFKTAEDEKQGKPEQLSAKPIQEWMEKILGQKVDFAQTLEQAATSDSKVVLLENIRFFHGEVEGDIDFAHKLAALGEVYVNEAFSSYIPAASTTMVPTLLPHAAGLHFAEEVRVLREIRENPKKPLVVIMGGAKVADKLPVITVLAEKAGAVLVGGKLIHEIREQNLNLSKNVMVGMLTEDGFDIANQTTQAWKGLIQKAAMIVWNGPLGKFEDPKNEQSAIIARMILDSQAEIVVGGGDTVSLLESLGTCLPAGTVLEEYEKKGFVSVGGGAMLKFLSEGTLPTIEALK